MKFPALHTSSTERVQKQTDRTRQTYPEAQKSKLHIFSRRQKNMKFPALHS